MSSLETWLVQLEVFSVPITVYLPPYYANLVLTDAQKNCWKLDHFTKEKRKLFEMTWNIKYFKILITFHKNGLVPKNNRLGLVCVAVTILPTLIISVTNHQSSIKVTFLESALNYKLTVSHSMCASVHGELQKWNLYFVTGEKANTTCPNALSHQCRHRIPTSKKIKATFTTWVFSKNME